MPAITTLNAFWFQELIFAFLLRNLSIFLQVQRIQRIKAFPYFWILQDSHPHTLNGISLLLSVQNITAPDRKVPCPPSFKETAEGSQRSMLEV